MEASGSEQEPRNWTARVLAPVALAAVVAAAFLVINGSMDDDGDGDTQTTVSETCNAPADQALEDGFYILKPDEPGLSAVADRTCMTVDELSELNPDLDPQLIGVGQCINLRPDGCEDAG